MCQDHPFPRLGLETFTLGIPRKRPGPQLPPPDASRLQQLPHPWKPTARQACGGRDCALFPGSHSSRTSADPADTTEPGLAPHQGPCSRGILEHPPPSTPLLPPPPTLIQRVPETRSVSTLPAGRRLGLTEPVGRGREGRSEQSSFLKGHTMVLLGPCRFLNSTNIYKVAGRLHVHAVYRDHWSHYVFVFSKVVTIIGGAISGL